MNVKKLTLSLIILIIISACSGTNHAYYQTLKIAFTEQDDAEMTLAEIRQSEVDVISVKRGERPAAIMALAYLENGQHKWVSSDKTMLIMDKGRIIRTVGLSENLLFVSNISSDPLKSLANNSKDGPQQQAWSRIIDRTDDEYGYFIESIFNTATQVTLKALNLNIKTSVYVETLNYQAPADYIRLNTDWVNEYWYAESGDLIKSIQKISPLSDSIEITYLSRIARLTQ
jgi:hypothetical protein